MFGVPSLDRGAAVVSTSRLITYVPQTGTPQYRATPQSSPSRDGHYHGSHPCPHHRCWCCRPLASDTPQDERLQSHSFRESGWTSYRRPRSWVRQSSFLPRFSRPDSDFHSIAPNGQTVLEKIPGLLEEIRAAGSPIEAFRNVSVMPEDYGILSELSGPAATPNLDGPLPIGIRRAVLLKTLAAYAEKAGVSLRWNHNMESLEQTEEGVKVRFANGAEEEGSFVVGCDGLHSNVRKVLFGDEKAGFTGLACVRFDESFS